MLNDCKLNGIYLQCDPKLRLRKTGKMIGYVL